MPCPDPVKTMDVLTHRGTYLSQFLGGPIRKPELVSALDVSRSTVDRTVDDLTRHGLIERTSEGYRATPFGRLVFELSDVFERSLRGLCDAYEVGEALPNGEHGEVLAFNGAELVHSEPHAPDLPLREFLRIVKTTNRIRAFTPAIYEQYVETLHHQIEHDEMNAELVVTPAVHRLLSTTYAERFVVAERTGRLEAYESTRSMPFGLALCERTDHTCLFLHLYGRNGLRALVRNSTPVAVGWGEQLFERFKSTAKGLSRPQVPG